jgi:hypothetical protein
MHGPKQLYPLHPSDDVDGIPACEPLTPRRGRGSVVPDGIDSKQVRAWARVNGWPMLGDRGRLPQDAIDQYLQVHA